MKPTFLKIVSADKSVVAVNFKDIKMVSVTSTALTLVTSSKTITVKTSPKTIDDAMSMIRKRCDVFDIDRPNCSRTDNPNKALEFQLPGGRTFVFKPAIVALSVSRSPSNSVTVNTTCGKFKVSTRYDISSQLKNFFELALN